VFILGERIKFVITGKLAQKERYLVDFLGAQQ